MNIKHLVICSLICILAIPAKAQYKYKRQRNRHSYRNQSDYSWEVLMRYSCGYIQPFMAIDIKQKFFFYNYTVGSNGDLVESSTGSAEKLLKYNKMCTSSGGGIGIITIPLSRMNYKNGLSFEFPISGTYYHWDLSDTKLNTDNLGVNQKATSTQLSIGIGVKYQYGGEVLPYKQSKFLFGLGAGALPTFAFNNYIDKNITSDGRIYFMAEMGIYAGIGFKLRATYFSSPFGLISKELGPNNYVYNNAGTAIKPDKIGIDISTPGDFTLSLLIMPFSGRWYDRNDN